MRDFKHCKTCSEFHYTDQSCPPIHNVLYEEYMGDEPMRIHADDHEEAARKFGQHYNEHQDYNLMKNPIEVSVERGGVAKRFEVSAEPSIHYNVKEL